MLCKECKTKPVARGIKNIHCARCKKDKMVNSGYNTLICEDCSNEIGKCVCCGKYIYCGEMETGMSIARNNTIASNTKDCFKEFVGMKLKGVLFDAFPFGNKSLSNGTKTLVFEDGRGLTISDSGTYWIESRKDISAVINQKKEELDSSKRDIEEILTFAGEI